MKNNIKPIIILNKSDLCESTDDIQKELVGFYNTVPFIFMSAFKNIGVGQLQQYLVPGITAALVGSSGVGKSTIINSLFGNEQQDVKEVREDDSKGRHTTTVRQMFLLEDGALLIDTPGMRELEPWDSLSVMDEVFDDIAQFAKKCYFKDCTHNHEPDCAVQKAISENSLPSVRFNNYQKMLREQEYQRMLLDEKGHIERRRKDKEFGKMCKQIMSKKIQNQKH